jgi:Tol biopolymer transport system component
VNETKIREQLFDLASDAPTGGAAPTQLVRRAHRRVALTLACSIVIPVALIAGGIAGVQALRSSGGQPAKPPAEGFASIHGWIAYWSGFEIVAVDPANPSDSLSLGPAWGGDPIAWSSDGTQLLLSDPAWGHAVLRADGSLTLLNFPNGGRSLSQPSGGSFSPDGSMITYGAGGVYVTDAEGGTSPPRFVVKAESPSYCQEFAAWSPDGSRIAFIDFQGPGPYGLWCDESQGLFFVNPDGTGLQEELHLPVGYDPGGIVWSPDGSQLVIWGTYEGDDPREGMYVVNADGSGLRQISSGANDRWAAWSPDGTRIAFVRERQLFTMASDGSDVQKVEGASPEGSIAWNPIG